VARLFKGEEYEILDRFMGKELEGKEYEPLFTYERPEKKAWYVICADFVTMDEGTGIVHIAPAFGEEDYEAGREYDLPVVQLVKKDGTFDEKVEPWKGMFVKDADPLIIKHLEERGLIFAVQDYTHDYPFCWRCDTPLLYYAMESWFIAVSKFRKQLVTFVEISLFPELFQGPPYRFYIIVFESNIGIIHIYPESYSSGHLYPFVFISEGALSAFLIEFLYTILLYILLCFQSEFFLNLDFDG